MKPNKINISLAAAILFILAAACKKQDYYQVNPNLPSVATPSLLLTNIEANTFNMWPMDIAYASRHMTYYERPNVNVNYNWSTAGFGAYDILSQVRNMDELASKAKLDNYRGLGKFFRALLFTNLTETFGDIPYSEALKAQDGNVKPKYDAQKDVYAGVLNELEEANALLDPAKGTIQGDIIYGGNAGQWKKLVNALRLRILIHLSKKESDATLNVKQQFQSIISNPTKYPLMTSNSDNGQLVYNTTAVSNYYPTYQNNSIPSLAALEKGFVSLLKNRNDPRLFKIAEPITGQPAGVFSSYDGVDAGLTVADQNGASPFASKIARRYIEDPVNEPMITLGYAEQEFLIAEGIARGWATGNAAQHYNNGITASMKFYGISDAEISNYLAQPTVAYNPANAIPMIITQKYIAFFLNSGTEPFFEQRRTGIPTFSTGPGTQNGGKVPKRWMYPQSEFSYNGGNVQEAVSRQYSGNDDINGLMWVLQ
jgi:hypothetical protein